MLELHQFLNDIKTSPEFRGTVFRAAVASGYDPNAGDETAAEDLEQRITVLMGQILFELTDERFSTRTHHRRKLYDDGCKGPLCRKAERDRSRQRYRRGNPGGNRNRRRSLLDDAVLEYVADKYDDRNKKQLGGAA